jgi:hypothetical protein
VKGGGGGCGWLSGEEEDVIGSKPMLGAWLLANDIFAKKIKSS